MPFIFAGLSVQFNHVRDYSEAHNVTETTKPRVSSWFCGLYAIRQNDNAYCRSTKTSDADYLQKQAVASAHTLQ